MYRGSIPSFPCRTEGRTDTDEEVRSDSPWDPGRGHGTPGVPDVRTESRSLECVVRVGVRRLPVYRTPTFYDGDSKDRHGPGSVS